MDVLKGCPVCSVAFKFKDSLLPKDRFNCPSCNRNYFFKDATEINNSINRDLLVIYNAEKAEKKLSTIVLILLLVSFFAAGLALVGWIYIAF